MTDPTVTAVIATRGRPELLRVAVRSILDQNYAGPIEVIVVYDRIEIDPLRDIVPVGPIRTLRTIANNRSAGLAGGRNTGIALGTGDLIAFCDDDDAWEVDKLDRQVQLLATRPDAAIVGSGIRIESDGGVHERLPPEEVGFAELLRSRITEIHPSSFLLRRADLLGRIGLVDEVLPASYGEDYDLLLRAAKVGAVVSVAAPLVTVGWKRTSFFSERWQGIADGLTYLLEKFPQFAGQPVGHARIAGQVAFAHAALGHRRDARRWAAKALQGDPRQLRAYAALAVSARICSPGMLVALVNRTGRGL